MPAHPHIDEGAGVRGIMLSGIRTATTFPRAQASPLARTVTSTMTLFGFTSTMRPRASSGTPIGVGRR